MTVVRGNVQVKRERPQSDVTIQAANRTFREQKGGSHLPASITLMAIPTNVKAPVYQWQYLNDSNAWVDITGAKATSYNVVPGTWLSRAFRVQVTGQNIKQPAYDTMVIDRVEYQLGDIEDDVRKADYLLDALKDLATTTAGLSLARVIAAMDSNNVVKSYMAGMPDLNPTAFAAGVENFGMTNETKNIALNHEGSAKLGALLVDIAGMLYTKDPVTDEIKFKINGGTLPSLASLLSNTFIGGSNTNTPQSDITDTYVLPNKLNITQDDSQVNVNIGVSLFAQGSMTETSTAVAELWLYRDGGAVRILGVVGLYSLGNGEIMNQQIEFSESVQNLVKGEYGIGIHIQTLNNPIYARASIGASTMSWEFKRENVQRLEIALNGMMQFYTEGHWYFTKEGFFLRGLTDMPGELLSATVASGGGWSYVWGAKTKTSTGNNVNTPVKNSTGRYTVYHSLGHSRYQVFASAHTANRSHHIVSKGDTSFIIEWRTIGSSPSLADTTFDVEMVGDNY